MPQLKLVKRGVNLALTGNVHRADLYQLGEQLIARINLDVMYSGDTGIMKAEGKVDAVSYYSERLSDIVFLDLEYTEVAQGLLRACSLSVLTFKAVKKSNR